MVLSLLLSAVAAPPGLALDPAHPPVLLGESDGLPVYRFAPHADWKVRPAVVVESGLQPTAEAHWLGGPYWRIPASDPVTEALSWRAAGTPAFPDVVIPHERRGFDDPSYGGQWYLQKLGMEDLYSVTLGDPDIRVAVIDSGIDIHHPDLESAVLDPYDAWSDDEDPSPDPGEFCNDGSQNICDEHGTAVSGIILARANNGDGIVGMCPQCTLVPIKLLGEGNGPGISGDIAAFQHATDENVSVINNSWGFTQPTPVPDLLAKAIHEAATESRGGLGALVIFAAGNDDRELGSDEMEALPDVLCVSATDSYGRYTNYTNYGDAIGIAAPSATVSIAPGDTVITNFGGTSAAAPVATGMAAWAMSVSPDLSAADLHQLMIDTAVPSPFGLPDDNGHDLYYGYGQLSAANIKEALLPPAADTSSPEKSPKACGCASGSAPSGLALLALLALRRRR